MLEQIRQLVQASRFLPFAIVLPNGQSLKVPRPDFIWLPPDKKSVLVAMPKGGSRIINLQMIVALETRGAKV